MSVDAGAVIALELAAEVTRLRGDYQRAVDQGRALGAENERLRYAIEGARDSFRELRMEFAFRFTAECECKPGYMCLGHALHEAERAMECALQPDVPFGEDDPADVAATEEGT